MFLLKTLHSGQKIFLKNTEIPKLAKITENSREIYEKCSLYSLEIPKNFSITFAFKNAPKMHLI